MRIFGLHITGVFLISVLLACYNGGPQVSGGELLQKSIAHHDPGGRWANLALDIHIQEPRVGNYARWSRVHWSDSLMFQMDREVDGHRLTYRCKDNNNITLFNDNMLDHRADTALIKQYRLQSDRVDLYHDFYKTLIGLPMSLPDRIKTFTEVKQTNYNGIDAHAIGVILNKPLFSDRWVLYVARDDHRYLGMEIIDNNNSNDGERLYFTEWYDHRGVKLARVRHWYDRASGDYSGTDIILKHIR